MSFACGGQSQGTGVSELTHRYAETEGREALLLHGARHLQLLGLAVRMTTNRLLPDGTHLAITSDSDTPPSSPWGRQPNVAPKRDSRD
ncbi:hypothetical protein AAFF_G00101720 [Aldrovandia affinis]|uniref:Uncharacterized protein n=1 Tax=Aldrovandia affinis TaxID=143900 RepID=A0AAD7WB25_9TELE|nr:hypothetical protein AAFF_G00101720 [Aldrovandia affinis]